MDYLDNARAALSLKNNTNGSLKHSADETSSLASPIPIPAQKQLKYTPGIVNGRGRETATFTNLPLKPVLLHNYLNLQELLIAYRWFHSGNHLLERRWQPQAKEENYGDGKGVIISGYYSLNGSGRNHGGFLN
ncbi:hypothetical protein KSP39_PZI022164 [Platanthera zijinensis]|uniref:Uncharacterized protein n=1 Tax=Platanthera zijinensis TaxID=2320716 RepID=A0AAP0FUX1_9ASPA